MKTDGIFTTKVVEVPFKKYNEPITLWASGDWHYNSPNCDKEKFDEFIEEAQGDYLVGLGDYLDSISTSERKAFRAMSLHDSTVRTLEELYRSHVDDVASKLKGIKVLGLCGGNHFYEFPTGVTTDHLLCEKLKAKYLGVNCLLRLILRYDKKHAHVVDIVMHHGKSGTTLGSGITQLVKMANNFHCHIVLQGHNHQIEAGYKNRLCLTSNHILENRKILLGRTGSFLKAYEDGNPSYAVDAGYDPASLGALKILITPRRDKANKQDKRWVDIKAVL